MQFSKTVPALLDEYSLSTHVMSDPVVDERTFPQYWSHGDPCVTSKALAELASAVLMTSPAAAALILSDSWP